VSPGRVAACREVGKGVNGENTGRFSDDIRGIRGALRMIGR